MKRIIFVDDEPRILEGIRRMLRPMRREWEMVFVGGGEAALAELKVAPFDVIVSDMRMPGMDGATLLKHVQERFPNVVRIVLSGHTDPEAALRAVPVAHQFLSKPCDAEALQAVVQRACSLKAFLSDETVRGAIGQVDVLPSVPRLYMAVSRALADPDSSLDDIANVVEQDAAMCAKILHLVSSAFFGIPRRVGNIHQAVTYLGTSMIKNIVLSVEVFRTWSESGKLAGFSIDAEQSHALLTSRIAMRIMGDKSKAEDAFMAAMLHDVGKLILATYLPDEFARVIENRREQARPMHVIEQEVCGVTHAEVGAYLLGIWGLPYPIVEAVAYHHAPTRVPHERFEILDAVHVANLLAREHESASPGGAGEICEEINASYLEALGMMDQLPAWREIVTEQANPA